MFWVNVFVADLKSSWKFSLSSDEISLSWELQGVSNSTAISLFMCLFLSTKHCFKLSSKGEISTDWMADKLIIGTLQWLLLDCFGQRLLVLLFLFDNRNNVSLFHGVKPANGKVKWQFLNEREQQAYIKITVAWT